MGSTHKSHCPQNGGSHHGDQRSISTRSTFCSRETVGALSLSSVSPRVPANEKRPSDALCARLRDAMVTLRGFYKRTMPVWNRRVERFDGCMQRLAASDVNFLERAEERLGMCFDQIEETLKTLKPFTPTSVAVSEWGRYAQKSYDLLLTIKSTVVLMQSRVARLLEVVRSAPASGSPAALRRTFLASSARWGVSPVLSSCAGHRGGVFPSGSLPPRSESSVRTLSRTLTVSRSPFPATNGGSSLSPGSGRQQPQRQQDTCASPPPRCALFSAQRPPQHSPPYSKSVSPMFLSSSRVSEPFYELGKDGCRSLNLSKSPFLFGDCDRGSTPCMNSTRKEPFLYVDNDDEGALLNPSACHGKNMGALGSDERYALLERIAAIEKSPFMPSNLEIEEAEGIFIRLYGIRHGPRQYSEWIDDMKFRALRRR